MKNLNRTKIVGVLAISLLSFTCAVPLFAVGPTPVNLLSAGNFVVLAGSTITNTGSSVINGDLGLSPGTSVTGFPPGVLNGVQHINDATVIQAQIDLVTAYNSANQIPVSTVPAELGGTTKIAGVYESIDGSFAITGTLILDAQNDPSAVFIFKSSSTLITGGASNVVLLNGAQACNIVWQVGSSATLGTNSIFKGNIIALTSATITTGANVEGRILTRNGAVTLDSSSVTKPVCVTPPPAPIIVGTTTVSTTTPVIFATTTPVMITTATTTSITIATTTVPVTNTTILTPSASPQFPNTGIAPEEENSYWYIIASITLILLSAPALGVLVKRKEVI